MRQRRLLVILIALSLSLITYFGTVLLVQQPVALAHAFVIGSDPVDGSTVNKVPTEVHIFFNAPISSISSAHIYLIKNGNTIDVGAAASAISATDPRELVTPIKTPDAQPEGSYEVKWTAVANEDGHTSYGIIGFNVGFSSTGVSSGTTVLGPGSSNSLDDIRNLDFTSNGDFTRLLAIAWDWLVLTALTFWVGLLLIDFLLKRDKGRYEELLARIKKKTQSLQWLCLTVLLCGDLIGFMLRALRSYQALFNGLGLSSDLLVKLLLATNYGHYLLARIVLIVLAMGILYRNSRHEKAASGANPTLLSTPSDLFQRQITQEGQLKQDTGPRKTITLFETSAALRAQRIPWGELLLAALIMGTYVLSRDAAQVLQPHVSAMLFDWLSLAAESLWFGGFAYLGYVLLPIFSNTELDYYTETLITLLRCLTPFLLVGIAVLLVCDLFLSEASISNAQQWLNDPYGRTLLVQTVVLLLMLLLSLYALFAIKPKFVRQARLLPVVDNELPARRTRQIAIGNTRRGLQLVANVLAVLGACVLLCNALMLFFAPPIVYPDLTYSNPPAQPGAITSVQTQQIGGLTATLLVQPARSGTANTVLLTLADSSGKAISDAQVRLTTSMQSMDMGTTSVTIDGGSAAYVAAFNKQAFSMAGLWNINVMIQRPGQAAVQGSFQVMLAT